MKKKFLAFFVLTLYLFALLPVLSAAAAGADAGKAVITDTQLNSATEKIDYPQLSGLKNASVQNQINSVLKNMAVKQANPDTYDLMTDYFHNPVSPFEFSGSSSNNLSSAQSIGESQAQADPNGSQGLESTLTYEIKYQSHNLVSITYLTRYETGGSHPNWLLTGITFSLTTGKFYTLDDLMKDTSYKSSISQIIKNQVDQRGALPVTDPNSLKLFKPFTSIQDKQEYYLTDSGIVVYYQAYAIAAYVYSTPEFTVAYTDMKDYIKDDFKFLYDPTADASSSTAASSAAQPSSVSHVSAARAPSKHNGTAPASGSAAPVAAVVASVILLAAGGAAAYIFMNMAAIKEISSILSAGRQTAAQTPATLKGRLKAFVVYWRFRKHTFVFGKESLEEKGELIDKTKLKFRSDSKLLLDLTEALSRAEYHYLTIRYPQNAMRFKHNVSVSYACDDSIVDTDTFESNRDFQYIRNVEIH